MSRGSEGKPVNQLLSLSLALCLLVLPACFVEADNGRAVPVASSSGSLVLDWTIDGSSNPDHCDLSDASTMDVTVTTPGGSFVGEFQESCRAFVTSVDLSPGNYRAAARLLDGAGHDRTTSVEIRAFTILGNDELSVPIDFPASSFY